MSRTGTQAEVVAPNVPEFAITSVKPNKLNDGRWKLQFTLEGYSAMGVTVRKFIQEAYGIFEEDRISGVPNWADTQKYDIQARVDDTDLVTLHKLNLDQRRLMLQALLADRSKLRVHREDKDLPIYALILQRTVPGCWRRPPKKYPLGRLQVLGVA